MAARRPHNASRNDPQRRATAQRDSPAATRRRDEPVASPSTDDPTARRRRNPAAARRDNPARGARRTKPVRPPADEPAGTPAPGLAGTPVPEPIRDGRLRSEPAGGERLRSEPAGGEPSGEHDSFTALGLPGTLVDALAAEGITAPRPIQSATLPDSLAGRDVLGRGRTGSGKTYAFVLPVLARLAARPQRRRPGRPRAMILVPTRELATQIQTVIAPLAAPLGLRSTTIFGGVGANPQIRALRAGVDIIVACPGRLADHIGTGEAALDAVEITVLDEADHMADLGFLPAVRRLLEQTPRDGQRLLFSATLDGDVKVLVNRFLSDPVTHSVDSALSPVAAMQHHVLHVSADDRIPVLVELASAPGRTLVFTRTKYRAKALTRKLVAEGVTAVELHGNLGQNARQRNLAAFAEGTATTLVATDIAARGIHVDDVALVVHADPPVEHKAYLHRSGRTARGDAGGTVVTLMTSDQTREVRDLSRKAGITPTTARVAPGDPLLHTLAPGERTLHTSRPVTPTPPTQVPSSARRSSGGRDGRAQSHRAPRAAKSATPRSPAPTATATRSGTSSSAASFSARTQPRSARRGGRAR